MPKPSKCQANRGEWALANLLLPSMFCPLLLPRPESQVSTEQLLSPSASWLTPGTTRMQKGEEEEEQPTGDAVTFPQGGWHQSTV